jgi:hypothetical protein
MRIKNNRKLLALLFILLLLESKTRARPQFPGSSTIINFQPSSFFVNQGPKTTGGPFTPVYADLAVRTTIKRAMRTKNNRKLQALLLLLLLLSSNLRHAPDLNFQDQQL